MTVLDVAAVIYQLLPEPQSGLLAGILFGVKNSLSTELYDALITTGTLHIVALSGQNISLLIGFISILLLRYVKRPIANILSIGVIGAFIWFVGPSASVVRAGVMGTITLLGIAIGKQVWPLVVWMLAVAGMLLLNPLWIGDLSFQLSSMATLGILLFGQEKKNSNLDYRNNHQDIYVSKYILSELASIVHDGLRVTLAAQVFTIPIILFAFGRISLISPLTNLLIGSFIAPIMLLGFATVILGLVWLPLGQVAAWCVWLPLTVVIKVIELTSQIPFASIGV